MVEFLRDDDGQPVHVCGYAAVWNSISHPHPAWGDRPGLFLPSAFDAVLKRPLLSLTCEAYHLANAVMGSHRDLNLQVWKDSHGLAFCAGPVRADLGNASTIRAIAAGRTRGASTSTTTAEEEVLIIGGEEVMVIKCIKTFEHLSPVAEPSDDATVVWLSTEEPHSMPPHIRALAEIWSANKPRRDTPAALRHMTQCAAARKPVLAHAVTSRPQARSRVPAPSPYVSMGFGLTSREWEEFAFQEEVGQRWRRDEARKRAHQKARRTA